MGLVGISQGARFSSDDRLSHFGRKSGHGGSLAWVEGGKFCGSRGMALPLLGLQAPPEGRVG